MDSQNLYQTKLGWFVSLETAINDFGIALKSILWIVLFGVAATYLASWISVSIGLVNSKISFDILVSFSKLAWGSFSDSAYLPTLKNAASIIGNDMLKLFLYHLSAPA